MSRRNIDRIPPEIWRERAPSVWRMLAQDWRITRRCMKCGANGPVDLEEVGRKLGPQYSLWDRASRCRQLARCWGLVIYFGHPPGLHSGFALCSGEVLEAKLAQLERVRQAFAAKQPNSEDPRNFVASG